MCIPRVLSPLSATRARPVSPARTRSTTSPTCCSLNVVTPARTESGALKENSLAFTSTTWPGREGRMSDAWPYTGRRLPVTMMHNATAGLHEWSDMSASLLRKRGSVGRARVVSTYRLAACDALTGVGRSHDDEWAHAHLRLEWLYGATHSRASAAAGDAPDARRPQRRRGSRAGYHAGSRAPRLLARRPARRRRGTRRHRRRAALCRSVRSHL